MVDVNRITLCGNLTRDPIFKQVGNNSLVCEFRIAVNRVWFTKTGERQKKTCYIDIEAWNNIAAKCRGVLTKGSPVYVDGSLEYDSWTDKDNYNVTNSRHYVKAEVINFFGDPRKLDDYEKKYEE